MALHELRQALRSLRADPGYASAALLTLALGIGANAAIFSLIYGVLLRPLPYRHGDELVLIQQSAPRAAVASVPLSIQEVIDYREQSRSLSALVEYHGMSFTLLGRGEPERVATGVVSADFFDALGLEPLHGRDFTPEDERHGAEAVLLLSHGYWQRSFGSDPGIVGQVFEMNDRPHRVIGVLPPVPQFPRENDVYMPTAACPFRAAGDARRIENRSAFRALVAFGRRRPGVSVEQVQADFAGIAGRFVRDHPESYPAERGLAVTAAPLKEQLTRAARPTLMVLLGTAALVLLIACANVANLTLSRALRRERERAVRAALGASRARLVRLSLVESALLAAAGGALGLLVAHWGLDLLVAFTARFTPRALGIEIDGWVLAFTAAASLASGLLFGAAPLATPVRDLTAALREGGQATASPGRLRLRGALIVAQVAISATLLVGAGLMLRSLHRLQLVDPGFDTDNVLSAQIFLNWTRYQGAEPTVAFFDALLERLQGTPGVVSAALSNTVPLGQGPAITTAFRVESRPLEPGEAEPQLDLRVASPGYFRTLGVPILRGRGFEASDRAENRPVAAVNESLAARYWPGRDPIGDCLSIDGGSTWLSVVGVVGDVRQYSLDQAASDELYLPVAQAGFANRVLLRSVGDPAGLARELKRAVYAVDPQQPVSRMETLSHLHAEATASPRLTARLLSLFAGLALLITATGIGGVIAFSVSQRTREIGIRMALGADRRRVLLLILRQGMWLTALGLLIGLGAALAFGRALAALLYETAPGDPLTLLAVAALLASTAALACLLPARRATRVDPTVALRAG